MQVPIRGQRAVVPSGLRLIGNLDLDRCPHCGIARPHLAQHTKFESLGNRGRRLWATYACTVCGGAVVAACASEDTNATVLEYHPALPTIQDGIPPRATECLKQATESLAQPMGSIMLSASAVDAMLKARGYKEGSLYTRIDLAAKDHVITEDMAKWAHQVRLDANDQRHSDEDAPLPNHEDARRCLDFAFALAEVMFVLPGRVTRGIEETKGQK